MTHLINYLFLIVLINIFITVNNLENKNNKKTLNSNHDFISFVLIIKFLFPF